MKRKKNNEDKPKVLLIKTVNGEFKVVFDRPVFALLLDAKTGTKKRYPIHIDRIQINRVIKDYMDE